MDPPSLVGILLFSFFFFFLFLSFFHLITGLSFLARGPIQVILPGAINSITMWTLMTPNVNL